MNRHQRTKDIAAIAVFMAVMLVIEVVSQSIFAAFPTLLVKPTLTHIPVILASIYYGPRVGASLGGFMGLMSLTRNTIWPGLVSYVFSPFVEGGNLASLVIAILPRVLIGVVPYLVYRAIKSPAGLGLAGAMGSLTNTVLVLSGMFFFFPERFGGKVQSFLQAIVATNSLLEVVIATTLTLVMVPRLSKVLGR